MCPPVRIELNGDDSISGLHWTMYQIDNGTLEMYSGPFGYRSPDAIHTLKFCSQDKAGNVGHMCNLTFKIHMSAPLLLFSVKNNTKSFSSSVQVLWSSTDAGSGVYRTEWRLGDGPWQLCSGDSIKLTELSDGNHVLELKSTDYVGHNITKSLHFTVNTNVFSLSGPLGPWLDIGLAAPAMVAILLVLWLKRKKVRAQEPP